MATSKVALALGSLTLDQKAALLVTIVAKMTDNPNFKTPDPALNALTDANLATVNQRNKRDTLQADAKQATTDLKALEALFDKLLTALGAYVENIAQGSKAIIESAGMPASADTGGRPDPHKLPAPEGLAVTMGDAPGEVDPHWHRVTGAGAYELHYGQNGPDTLDHQMTVVGSKAVLTGLTPGKEAWVVVYAVGTAGRGAPSQPARCMVP